MNKDLINRINQFNQIKYKDNFDKRIIVCTLKTKGTVTTAPNNKEQQANVTKKKFKIFK